VPPPLPNYDYDRKYDGLTQRLYSVPSRQVGNGVRVGVDVGVGVGGCGCGCVRVRVCLYVYACSVCVCVCEWVCVH